MYFSTRLKRDVLKCTVGDDEWYNRFMLDSIEQHRSQILALCRKYDVRRLELFGSAARGQFDPNKSDFDFLVAFARDSSMNSADQYLGLLVALGDLLGRKVDLVDISAARNPYFVADALKHRVMLYAA